LFIENPIKGVNTSLVRVLRLISFSRAEEKKKTSLDDWLVQENELKKRVYESEGEKIAL